MADFVSIPWGDGEHKFRLPLGQIRELQEKCGAGPATILTRLIAPQADFARLPAPEKDDLPTIALHGVIRTLRGDWRIDDIRETIRLGLIGGGMTPADAHRLTVRYVDDRPPLENISVAAEILMAALMGNQDDPVGKTQAGEAVTETQTSV